MEEKNYYKEAFDNIKSEIKEKINQAQIELDNLNISYEKQNILSGNERLLKSIYFNLIDDLGYISDNDEADKWVNETFKKIAALEKKIQNYEYIYENLQKSS